MKVLVIFGTRPEAIKLAPVINQLKIHYSKFKTIVCVTAQHRALLDQVLNLFGIDPDCDLNVMSDDQDLFDITTKILTKLRETLKKEKPGLVLVQGDTTSSFVATLAAFYLKIPVGHVEAGLRTYTKYSPFPEEKNRQLTSLLVDFHFAPTEWAKSNLLKENIQEDRIWVTGNTIIDALMQVVSRQTSLSSEEYWNRYFKQKWNLTLTTSPGTNKLILVTCHRRESFGEEFRNICFALKEIAENRPEVKFVYPVHANPNVRNPARAILNNQPNIYLIEPLEYENFVFLMRSSYFILTDSGGIQEEAPSLGKPVLVMRNTTDRPEGIESGTCKLIGTKKDCIVAGTLELLNNQSLYKKMSRVVNPYGDGNAAKRIVRILLEKT